MFRKLKDLLETDSLFYSVLFVVVAVGSFGLGRLSMQEIASAPLAQPAAVTVIAQETAPEYYVGSKNGSKYHLPWCPGALRINEENKVLFDSVESAMAAGYTPAANCPGL